MGLSIRLKSGCRFNYITIPTQALISDKLDSNREWTVGWRRPDNLVELTAQGRDQATAAGARIKRLLEPGRKATTA